MIDYNTILSGRIDNTFLRGNAIATSLNNRIFNFVLRLNSNVGIPSNQNGIITEDGFFILTEDGQNIVTE